MKRVTPILVAGLLIGVAGVLALNQRLSGLPTKETPQPPKITIGPPVKAENLGKLASFWSPEADHLVYSLPEGAEVLAAISGEIAYLGFDAPSGNGFFDNIQLRGEDGVLVSYLLAAESEILIKQGDKVGEGQVLARARLGGKPGPGCTGGEVLGVYLFKDNPTKLTPDMIKVN